MNEAIWKIKERKYDDIITQILWSRGIIKSADEKEKIENFLSPDFSRLHDPFLMKGMKEAVARIVKAKEQNEKIGIFADYDADGIPGAALLVRAFRKIGVPFETYIPNRENGYGLSTDGIDFLVSKKCSLIITVDLGIKSYKEAKYCKKIGVDLIVTDHHLVSEELPEALAVVNPKIAPYPDPDLCGCGVAFKLVSALGNKFKEIDTSFLKWNLDLVAISTISDVVPLTGENRILAKYGLIVLSKTNNIGLLALYKTSKIEKENISTYVVGYQIGPRINAPGRVAHATKSYELLISEDEEMAKELALWLDKKNMERQKEMNETIEEVCEIVIKNNLDKNSIIIASGKWVKGIIGPAASRVVEKFNRPTLLFSIEDSVYCGSARSLNDINIISLLEPFEKLLMKFGGHKGAAGVTVSKENYNTFYEKMIALAKKIIKPEDLVKNIQIEFELFEKDLKISLYETIKKLEPFGMGNSKPIFMASQVEILNRRIVGKDQKHLSMKIKVGKKEIKAIYFNYCDEKLIKNHTIYDIVFSVDLDEWNGERNLSLNILDIKAHNYTDSELS